MPPVYKLKLTSVVVFLFILLSMLPNNSRAQSGTRKLSGVVLDENKKPLAGATINLPKSTKNAISNENGTFEVTISDNDKTLSVSYVGYETQEIVVGTNLQLTIELVSLAKLNSEVVVVGYGSQRKATITGSVAEIKGTDLLKSPSPNIANNIAGRVPGVIATNDQGEPGNDDPSILIRGVNTYSGSTAPLIVIDGVANRPGGFSRLNPNDIESISILKDASASIYGAQAANGVILVTTKKGKAGATQVSLNINQGFNNWTKIPERVSSFEYATLVNEDKRYTNDAPIFTDEELQKFKDGSDPINYPNTDWVKLLIKNVTQQNNINLTVSGGTEKTKYYGSFGRIQQNGQIKNTKAYNYEQYNLAFNLESQVNKILNVSIATQLRYTDRRSPANSTGESPGGSYGSQGSFEVFGGLLFSLPTQVHRYPDGRLGSTNPPTFSNPLATSSDIAGSAGFKSIYALNTFNYRLDIPGTKGLFFDGFISADFESSDTKDFGKSWKAYNFNKLTNDYIEVNQTASLEGLASLQQSSFNRFIFTVNSKLNYRHVFNNVHSVNSFVAFEQQKYNDRYFYTARRNFVTDNIDELNYGSPVNATNGGGSTNSARRNFFGRINYAYKNKYLLEVQARYDGSDKFSKEQRWGLFPSISAGWRVSEESWSKKLFKENELKLKASYGLLGNDGVDPYQFLQFYNLNTSGYYLNGVLVPTVSPGVLPNPNFTWEKASVYNIGIEGTFLNRSFSYTIDLFKQIRSDILTTRDATVPNYTGLSLPIVNYGKMQNQGIEVQLTYRKQLGQIALNTGINFTYTQNKVLLIDEAATLPAYQKQTGRSLNNTLLYIDDGLFTSQKDIDDYLAKYDFQVGIAGSTIRPGDVKFKDVNNDSVINSLDQVQTNGNTQPPIVFGYTASINWKDFDISLLFQGQAGTKAYFYPQSSVNFNYYKFLYDGRSTPENFTGQPTVAGAFFNRTALNRNTYSFFYRNTSFVRLKNFEIGYSLKKVLSKAKFSNARIYVNGSNIFTIAKFSDFDPESLNRFDARGYPIIRTINIGAQITF